MATYSSTLACRIPWTEGPGRLQSMGSRRVRRLSDFPFTFHFHALEKEMATHSSIRAWRIPGKGEPGGLPSMGSHRVGHDWSDLAAAAAVQRHDTKQEWNLKIKGKKKFTMYIINVYTRQWWSKKMCSNVLHKIKMSVQCLNYWRNEYLIRNNIQNGHLIKKYLDTLILARGISFLKIKVYSKKEWQRLRESLHSFIVISQWSRNFAPWYSPNTNFWGVPRVL